MTVPPPIWLLVFLLTPGCIQAGRWLPGEKTPIELPVMKSIEASTSTLRNGLRVAVLPSHSGTATVGLLVAGGPLNETAHSAGLSALLPDVPLVDGLLEKTLLRHGTTLRTVANGQVFGWVAHGKQDRLSHMLQVVSALPRRASQSLQNAQLALTRERRRLTRRESPAIYQAVGVATGAALGGRTPFHVLVTSEMWAKLTPEQVLKHAAHTLRPDRTILVVRTSQSLPTIIKSLPKVLKEWKKPVQQAFVRRVCWPTHPSTHLVISPIMAPNRLYSLVAIRIPGLGDVGRREVRTALESFTANPGGRLATRMGSSKAEATNPTIVDLGWYKGRGAAMLIFRVSGKASSVIKRTDAIVKALTRLGASPPKGQEWRQGSQIARAQEKFMRQDPLQRVVVAGARMLYGHRWQMDSPPQEHLSAIFRRNALVVVAVQGSGKRNPLLRQERRKVISWLRTMGQTTVWTDGGLIAGGHKPQSCRR